MKPIQTKNHKQRIYKSKFNKKTIFYHLNECKQALALENLYIIPLKKGILYQILINTKKKKNIKSFD